MHQSLSWLPGLLLLWGCSTHTTKVETDPDVGYKTSFTVNRKTHLHDGPYFKRDAQGLLLEKGTLVNGVQMGIRELYYPDGKVKVRERYANGHIDNLYQYYHPNGALQLKGYYVFGEMYGPWLKYTPEGQLTEFVMMTHNEENGPFTEYYPNGQLKTEGAYLHGPNESGTLKMYAESGDLEKTMLCYEGRCYTTWKKE
jgi:antitoxin component YwqK of YwqJK toxin-antitoxin module